MCCVTLLTELDDGRYMNILKLDETTTGRYVFILATAQDDDRHVIIPTTGRDDDRSIPRNDCTTYSKFFSAK